MNDPRYPVYTAECSVDEDFDDYEDVLDALEEELEDDE